MQVAGTPEMVMVRAESSAIILVVPVTPLL